jgi:hypothetical protein
MVILVTARSIARGDLHVRLPLAGHEALVTYAEREGISLNTALWLLVRRGLEQEGIRVEVGGRRPSASSTAPARGGTPPVDVDIEAAASAAVERAVAEVGAGAGRRAPGGPAPSSSAPPARPGPRRRRGRRR